MSAKDLGQIHTVNFFQDIDPDEADSRIMNMDVSGALTSQLQRMIRQGNFFKMVGLDMSLSTKGTVGGGQLSGYVRYFAPTQGRCKAYREAFAAMRNVFELQGISMRDNDQYDFRVGFNGLGEQLASNATIYNNASLDGSLGLNLVDAGRQDPTCSVFGVHNESVHSISTQAATNLFPTGFNTMGVQSSPTDFNLADNTLYSGNSDTASEDWEYIPFTMSWTPDTTDIATGFQYRPDPALYLAVMTGQLQLYVEEINLDGSADELELAVAVSIAGWKSIMGNPKKRSSRKKSSRKKGSSHRGHKK